VGTLLLGLLAGALTTLSPCVLPILPIVVLGAMNQHRLGPVALAAGLVTTFAGLGILLSGASWALDISDDTVRTGAAILMVVFGAILVSAGLQQRFVAVASPMTTRLHCSLERFTPSGLGGQFLLGALLGAVWTPCSGPTLGTALSLAANSETAAKAAAIMLVFSIGAATPLVAIAYGSREGLKSRRDLFRRVGHVAKPILGGILLFSGLLVLLGLDKMIETAFVDSMPDWLIHFTTRY
jgi:cytochrome c-type biogenesis protein